MWRKEPHFSEDQFVYVYQNRLAKHNSRNLIFEIKLKKQNKRGLRKDFAASFCWDIVKCFTVALLLHCCWYMWVSLHAFAGCFVCYLAFGQCPTVTLLIVLIVQQLFSPHRLPVRNTTLMCVQKWTTR